MFEYHFGAVQGLFDLINIFRLVTAIKKQGLGHHFSNIATSTFDLFNDLGVAVSPKGVDNILTLHLLLTAPNKLIISNLINSIPLDKLILLKVVLTEANVKSILDIFEQSTGLADPVLAFNITDNTNLLFVLNNLTIDNFNTLVSANNFVAFLGNLGVTLSTLTATVKNFLGGGVQSISLSELATSMPNYSSYTATLNPTFLATLVNVVNLGCCSHLTNFFGANPTLKNDINAFLTANLPHFDVTGLQATLGQFKNVLSGAQGLMDFYTGQIDSLNGLIASFTPLFTSYLSANGLTPEEATCVANKLEGLQTLKFVIDTQYLKPAKDTVNMYKVGIDAINEAIGAINSLKIELPDFNC